MDSGHHGVTWILPPRHAISRGIGFRSASFRVLGRSLGDDRIGQIALGSEHFPNPPCDTDHVETDFGELFTATTLIDPFISHTQDGYFSGIKAEAIACFEHLRAEAALDRVVFDRDYLNAGVDQFAEQ